MNSTTVNRNGLIEARFDGKPARQVIAGLKSHGFRWNGEAWTLRDPQTFVFVNGQYQERPNAIREAVQYACGATGTPLADVETILVRYHGEQTCRADRAMEDAQGING